MPPMIAPRKARTLLAAALLLALPQAAADEGAPALMADLQVLAVASAPLLPLTDDDVTFTARIANNGTALAGAFDVEFAVDNVTLGVRHVGGLVAGEYVEVTSPPWTGVKGEHTLRAVVDVRGAVAESHETNNRFATRFNITLAPEDPRADLRVGNVPLDEAPRLFDAVVAKVQVRNLGARAAGEFEVAFTLDGAELGRVTVDGLAIGADTTLQAPAWVAAAGTHTLAAYVDVKGQVSEANEANNVAARVLLVLSPRGPARPDLAVLDLATLPAAPGPGELVVLEAHAWNRGIAHAPASRAAFFVDGKAIGTVDVGSVGVGNAVLVRSPPWTATAGEHTFEVRLDVDVQVPEHDEANNVLAHSLRVSLGASRSADVVVKALRVQPAQPIPGQLARFTAEVAHRASPVEAAFEVLFTVDNKPLGKVVARLPAGAASVNVTSPLWRATEGGHQVRAYADAGASLAERNETNNAALLELVVAVPHVAYPQLVVVGLSAEVADPLPGDRFGFRATVRNDGDGPAGPFQVAFRALGTPLGEVTVPGLAPGAQVELRSEPWRAIAGPVLAEAVVDAGGAVRESNETDNLAQLRLDVAASAATSLTGLADPTARFAVPGVSPLAALGLLGLIAVVARRRR